MIRHATRLETLFVVVPEDALEPYETALATVCGTIGMFLIDEDARIWRVEGVKDAGASEEELGPALALAELMTGVATELGREDTEAEGWLARTYESFPEQLVGKRFAVRGTHLGPGEIAGRVTLQLDAGVAFGSGEHGSTRGCLRAFEKIMYKNPHRILDLGTGSGILAMGAAKLLHRRVLATDIDPWSVRVTRQNAALNHLSPLVRPVLATGWRHQAIKRRAPYNLVFANILARPLCKMARDLALHLAPGGTAILAGLLGSQERMVLAAHRRHGLKLRARVREGNWTCLVLGK
jgi:ribosomal protein L11 methyltransferase